MQNIASLLSWKPDGTYIIKSRCYRVARLFDECTPRREQICQKAAKLYRGVYAGNCVIIYEVDAELCRLIQRTK